VISLSLAPEPLEAGVARALVLEIANPSREHVLLQEARLSPGHASFAEGPSFSWRRSPPGTILYDAGRDRYVHATDVPGRAAVSLQVGLLPPGGRAEALVPVRLLASATVALSVAFRVGDLEGHVYSAPPGVAGTRVHYEKRLAPGPVIVRLEGLGEGEVRVEASLAVSGDAPLGVLGRSRALGWLKPGEVALEVVDALDGIFPGDPILVLFRGARAESVRGELGAEVINPARQTLVDYEKARALIEAVAREGISIRVGLGGEGLVVEG
jgi:hypothetical protein